MFGSARIEPCQRPERQQISHEVSQLGFAVTASSPSGMGEVGWRPGLHLMEQHHHCSSGEISTGNLPLAIDNRSRLGVIVSLVSV
jgi:hypothetical protein